MRYEVIGFRTITTYEKVYFEPVDASSEDEAVKLALEGHVLINDCKVLDYYSAEFVDKEVWYAKEL